MIVMSKIGFPIVSGKTLKKLMRVQKMSVMSQHDNSNNLVLLKSN